MNRLLFLCLLLFVLNTKGAGSPPLFAPNPISFFFSDSIPPSVICPASITLTAGNANCTATFTYTITVEDDQPGAVLSQTEGLPSGSQFPIGVTANSFSAIDSAGNLGACWFTVTVVQPQGLLICQDFIQFSLGSGCSLQLDAPQLLEPGSVNCADTLIVELDKTIPYGNGPWVPGLLGPADLGKSYQFRITDPATGDKCWGTVKAIDGQPPVMSCTDLMLPCALDNLTPAFLGDSLGIAGAFPSVTDNCGAVKQLIYQDTAEPEDCTSGYSQTIHRSWTATDNNGNSISCIQNIRLKLLQLSEITRPGDFTLDCINPDTTPDNTGKPYLEFGGKKYTNLCNIGYTFSDNLQQLCPGSDRIERTWAYIDWCAGAMTDSIQYIDIQGSTGPLITCDSSATVTITNTTNCAGAVDLPPVALTEDCSPIASIKAYWASGGMSDSLSGLLANGGTIGIFGTIDDFPAGSFLIHYVATDSCGNTGACDLNLQVWDGAPPLALCDSFSVVNLSVTGTVSGLAGGLNNGSTDDCGALAFKVRRADTSPCQPNTQFYDEVTFCCEDIGDTVAVILRVYDVPLPAGPVSPALAASQSSECTAYVKVTDGTGPKCALPPNITLTCESFNPSLDVYGGLVSQSCAVDSVAVSTNYSLFDTLCSRGTITRIFRVFDSAGNSGQCTQRITVTYNQDYFVRFPDDVILTACDGTGNFGQPQFFGEDCEFFGFSYQDETFTVVPDACYKIERTWTVINWCNYNPNAAVITVPNPAPVITSNSPQNLPGPVVSAPGTTGLWSPTISKINPTDSLSTNYSTFWSAGANGYKYKQIIKILDNQKPVIDDCPGLTGLGDATGNDPQLWNEPYWTDSITGSHDLSEAPADFGITASDLCSGSNVSVSYVLLLDLDGDGTQETAIDGNNPPAPGTVNYNNAGNPNYSGGTVQTFDERPVAADDKYRFAVHQSVTGGKRSATLQWKTAAQLPSGNNTFGLPGIAPQLPYGRHSIQWTVSDACGNQSECSYNLLIDGLAPEITCDSAVTVEIQANGFATLALADVLAGYNDNNAVDLLELSLRKAGIATGFPEDTSGAPIPVLLYGCNETGTHTVELWVRDPGGNTASCQTLVTVTDADSSCFKSLLSVTGAFTPAVEGVTVTLFAIHPQSPSVYLITTADGAFTFLDTVPSGADYTVTPQKDNNPLNGVSTYDLVLITQHILGIQPFDTPYKYIAADANKSNSITTFDVVEIRKLILGIYNNFPNNKSWRFVDADFAFPDPGNPFLSLFPESIQRTGITENQLEDDFVAIKVGDVNGTALVNDLVATDDRNRDLAFFETQDRMVKAGEECTVRFKGPENMLGYQFTLTFNDLEVIQILPGADMTPDNFGLFTRRPGSGAITASAVGPAGEFALKVRALKAGALRDMFSLSDEITRAEVYLPAENQSNTGYPEIRGVSLRFTPNQPAQAFVLEQNQPNPFNESTRITFQLPEEGEATLRIFDDTSALVYTQSGHFQRGRQVLEIDRRVFGGKTGVFFYQLHSSAGSAARRMVLIR
ncbi:MAG: HYR domain-containing protein [Lewinellaceae bacterium]|nr:HYR domain-containing protein [Lewinellaceae bacterium]